MNTNGPTLVLQCPQCGKLKTWFPALDEILSYLVSLVVREYLLQMGRTAVTEAASQVPPSTEKAP